MQRQRKDNNRREMPRHKNADILPPERNDAARLSVILANGFGVAENYGNVSRDRHYVRLLEGVSADKLLLFCQAYLNGGPLPRADPIADGPKLRALFEAASAAGLVELEFAPAGRFLPERK
ncbi:hypothetical protein L0Y65_01540 [Candidatus Micrarchaeota archaeon]|nr:hypothetical protein [Candidatus Micrarchaeota archaeon]